MSNNFKNLQVETWQSKIMSQAERDVINPFFTGLPEPLKSKVLLIGDYCRFTPLILNERGTKQFPLLSQFIFDLDQLYAISVEGIDIISTLHRQLKYNSNVFLKYSDYKKYVNNKVKKYQF